MLPEAGLGTQLGFCVLLFPVNISTRTNVKQGHSVAMEDQEKRHMASQSVMNTHKILNTVQITKVNKYSGVLVNVSNSSPFFNHSCSFASLLLYGLPP